jgi:hypothetical protein
MSLTPQKAKIDLPNQTRNTKWAWEIEASEDGQPIDFSDVLVKFAIVPNLGNGVVLELESGLGITEIETGVLLFEVEPPETNIPAETYFYDLRFERNGNTFVYAKGTIQVEQNVTTATEPT